MDESNIQVFINSVVHYFKQLNLDNVAVDTPYLLESGDPLAYDFTGIIGISGVRKGCVYFSCPKVMATNILICMGEIDSTDDDHCDMVGEVANTISGNARRDFGPEFLISVPVVVQGEPQRISLPKDARSIVIPIRWREHRAALVVCLK